MQATALAADGPATLGLSVRHGLIDAAAADAMAREVAWGWGLED